MTDVRYTKVAVWLHWLIALAIFGLIIFGFLMQQEWMPNRFAIYGVHKSIGMIILVLTVLRLFWRLAHRPPALPSETPRWQALASRSVHSLFYVMLIALPLLGWAMSSASTRAPQVEIFGLIPIPDLPVTQGQEEAGRWNSYHAIGAKIMIALMVVHIAAAFKHHWVDRDGVLARMAPWVKPKSG